MKWASVVAKGAPGQDVSKTRRLIGRHTRPLSTPLVDRAVSHSGGQSTDRCKMNSLQVCWESR